MDGLCGFIQVRYVTFSYYASFSSTDSWIIFGKHFHTTNILGMLVYILDILFYRINANPAGMFKSNNGNTRTMYGMCSKLTIKRPERRLSLSLPLDRFHTLFWRFHCWLWTSECRLENPRNNKWKGWAEDAFLFKFLSSSFSLFLLAHVQ